MFNQQNSSFQPSSQPLSNPPNLNSKFTKDSSDPASISLRSPEPKINPPKNRRNLLIKIGLIILAIVTILSLLFLIPSLFVKPEKSKHSEHSDNKSEPLKYYSTLSGEEIPSPEHDQKPTFCIQIPNGLDGARPHVGLHQAKVIFEAIAEGGITRFAAIFQDPTASAIGPIRSLRTYFLSWDTPFDCTVVHAGGSGPALAAIKAGGQRDLTESRSYMWRDFQGYYPPNNLFTSPKLLQEFNQSKNYQTSKVQGFVRYKPDDSGMIYQSENSTESDSKDLDGKKPTKNPEATNIRFSFGYIPGFNPVYQFDKKTLTYLRSYQDGTKHTSYNCPADQEKPHPKSSCGQPTQLAPKVIIAMFTKQNLAAYDYPGKITTIGSGKVQIFQNGGVINGTWNKASNHSQIEFKDELGKPIGLVPGQVWISVLPEGTGSVKY